MKIKLVQKGWEGYTGNFGGVDFRGGVSVIDVSDGEARRLANIVRIDRLDGTNPSSSQQALDSKSKPMGVFGADPITGKPEPKLQFTQEQLEGIADEKGIKGLREIGDAYGVKATGIAELIAQIMKAQNAKAATDAPAPAPQPAPEAAPQPAAAPADATPAAE